MYEATIHINRLLFVAIEELAMMHPDIIQCRRACRAVLLTVAAHIGLDDGFGDWDAHEAHVEMLLDEYCHEH